jgi:hypothetical protein
LSGFISEVCFVYLLWSLGTKHKQITYRASDISEEEEDLTYTEKSERESKEIKASDHSSILGDRVWSSLMEEEDIEVALEDNIRKSNISVLTCNENED